MSEMKKQAGTIGSKIKICGLCRREDVDYANLVFPDYIGMVFARSRRQVSAAQAAVYRAALDSRIQAVGVFVNAPVSQVVELLAEGVIDIAQLHGDESEGYLAEVRRTGKPVIKAVKVRSREDVEGSLKSRADYLLFDSGAGSGELFDWNLLQGIDRPYFLAGGLKPENIPEAVRRLHPFCIDLSSGVETDGKKDLEKMRRAVEAVR
ncbi:MAG: phosphoribosylanthranilate isomerase [Candidatus Gastranaerophilales bacterium]|nr:phosphoribosylanthranilate isomerase [Candidatus Gastranaerophilales bacterium]